MTGRSVAGWCQTCGEVVRWGVRRQFVCDGQRWRVWECGGCGGKRTLIRPATEADQEGGGGGGGTHLARTRGGTRNPGTE